MVGETGGLATATAAAPEPEPAPTDAADAASGARQTRVSALISEGGIAGAISMVLARLRQEREEMEAEMLEGCETAEYGDEAAAIKVSKCIAYMPPLLKRAMEAQQLLNMELQD